MALLQRVEETLNGSTCYILIRMTSSHEQTNLPLSMSYLINLSIHLFSNQKTNDGLHLAPQALTQYILAASPQVMILEH